MNSFGKIYKYRKRHLQFEGREVMIPRCRKEDPFRTCTSYRHSFVLANLQKGDLTTDSDDGSDKEEELDGGFLDIELDQANSASHVE